MKLKTTLFAAAAAIAVAPAAQAYEGLYGAIGAGLSMMPNSDVTATAGPLAFDTVQDQQNGIGVYTSLGYAYGNGWRTELELNYRNNDVDSWAADGAPGFLTGFPSGTLSGDISSYAMMFNVVKDLASGGFVPYIGAGVGFAHSEAELFGTSADGFSPLIVNDNDNNFAYQGIAGFAIKLSQSLLFDISYRYFRTLKNDFVGTLDGPPTPFAYDSDYVSHSIFAGLRWNFGGGSGVEYKDCWDGSSVPVSSECPPQLQEQSNAVPDPVNVIVYFDYDKSTLTAEADALVKEAAQRAIANNIQTVKVEGNADRSGSSAYNQALSQRRAGVVRDALVGYGVPADRINVSAFGEDNPAKPTEDGVREPLNRRTEVTISFQ